MLRASFALRYALLLWPLLLWLPAAPDAAERIEGRVVAIADGDTITVLTAGKKQVKVRLAEIDTPEARQPYGTRARQELSDLVFGKTVRVEVMDTDRYGRKVGRVHAQGADVNAEMIRRGAAWVYRQYSRDASLLAVEEEAKAAERGLWALPEAQRTPPWEWRAAKRGGRSDARPESSPPKTGRTSAGFSCAGKRVCGEMASCDEAMFYLHRCGLRRLDGDKDGTPCEKRDT